MEVGGGRYSTNEGQLHIEKYSCCYRRREGGTGEENRQRGQSTNQAGMERGDKEREMTKERKRRE